jgi:hypothetical protein
MVHLPYPEDPAFEQPRVPYVCTESYDGLGFLDYPNRAGWPRVQRSTEFSNFLGNNRRHPCDDRELERFFQAWIFLAFYMKYLVRTALMMSTTIWKRRTVPCLYTPGDLSQDSAIGVILSKSGIKRGNHSYMTDW